MATFAACPSDTPLVLHFHGGLNTLEDGLTRALQLGPVYRAAGAFPIFVCWRSGVTEVLSNALGRIVRERIDQRVAAVASRFSLAEPNKAEPRKGVGAFDGPSDPRSLNHALTRARERRGRVLDVDLAIRKQSLEAAERRERATMRCAFERSAAPRGDRGDVEGATQIRITATGVYKGSERARRANGPALRWRTSSEALPGNKTDARAAGSLVPAIWFGQVIGRVRMRFATGRDHGFAATVIEEILQKLRLVETWFSWMKSEITAAFDRASDCGGTALLRGLDHRWRAGQRPRIILVGHSAGAIYIANLIEQAKTLMPQARFEVVFLAPAVSFRRFARTLETNGDAISAIRNLSLADRLERADGYPGYPRSLLYFTAGVMEYEDEDLGDVPIVGMERYYSGVAPYDHPDLDRVREFFAARPGALNWIDGSSASDRVSTARRHGDFDADPGTQRTLARYVREGVAATVH